MILGGAAVLLGILWLPLGQAAGLLALPLAGFTVRVVEWIAGWSTPLSLEVSGWGVLIMYVLLGGVTILWMRSLPGGCGWQLPPCWRLGH